MFFTAALEKSVLLCLEGRADRFCTGASKVGADLDHFSSAVALAGMILAVLHIAGDALVYALPIRTILVHIHRYHLLS